jgi:predicted metal-dependent hydrolase
VLEFKPDPRYRRYWRLFRQGSFWDAHEVLEDLWQETPPGERAFYQGLIQVAASLHHLQQGNMHGADKLARTAREHLEPFIPSHRGVQLESLLLGLGACLDDARYARMAQGGEAVMRPRIPRVDLAFGLDPESTTD